MKVKIGIKIIDSNDEPIMLILDQREKDLIGSMNGQNLRFCAFPEDSNIQVIEEFMADEVDHNQLDMFKEFNIPIYSQPIGD